MVAYFDAIYKYCQRYTHCILWEQYLFISSRCWHNCVEVCYCGRFWKLSCCLAVDCKKRWGRMMMADQYRKVEQYSPKSSPRGARSPVVSRQDSTGTLKTTISLGKNPSIVHSGPFYLMKEPPGKPIEKDRKIRAHYVWSFNIIVLYGTQVWQVYREMSCIVFGQLFLDFAYASIKFVWALKEPLGLFHSTTGGPGNVLTDLCLSPWKLFN